MTFGLGLERAKRSCDEPAPERLAGIDSEDLTDHDLEVGHNLFRVIEHPVERDRETEHPADAVCPAPRVVALGLDLNLDHSV